MPRHPLRTAAGLLSGRLTYVHAGITHRCNLRCSMCRIYTRAGQLPEAPPERWREVAKILAAKGASLVSLGGGEPFTRSDLPEIVAAFANADFRVRVLTNGVALRRDLLLACLDAGLSDLSFSLDTLQPHLQEQFDGAPGGLEKRLANLAMLTEVLPQRIGVLINTVITALNLDELPKLSRFAETLGLAISFIPVHLSEEESHDFFGRDDALKFSEDAVAKLQERIADLLEEKRRHGHIANSRDFLAAIPNFLTTGTVDWKCHAGGLYLSLRPDAKASLCHLFETADAINVEEIETKWSEEYLTELITNCGGCLRPCWTEVSLLSGHPGAMWDQAVWQWRMSRRLRRPLSIAQIRELAGMTE